MCISGHYLVISCSKKKQKGAHTYVSEINSLEVLVL